MFGCIGRLGCLFVIAVLGAAGWYTQDAWLPKVRARFTSSPPPVSASGWEPLTAEGAARGRAAVEKLTRKDGPVYVNVGAGDLAAFVLDSVLHGFSPAATGAVALARDDRLYLRAQVSVADLGGPGMLGPLSSVLDGKQEFTIRGRLEVLGPGRAQFRVEEIDLKELRLPSAAIPRLVGRIAAKSRDSTIAADAIPVRVPMDLADVRVGNGRVTLYKALP